MDGEKIKVSTYFRTRKIFVSVFLILTVILGFIAPLKSFVLQWIIDAGGKEEVVRDMILGLLLVSATFLLESISRNMFSRLHCGALGFIRNACMNTILKRNIRQYSASSSTADLSLLTNDIKMLSDDYFASLYQLILFGIMLFFSFCMYIYIDPSMLLFVCIAAAAPLVLPRIQEKHLKSSRADFSKKSEEYVGNTTEILNGYEIIHGFGVQRLFQKKNEEKTSAAADSEYKFQKSINYSITLSSFLSNGLFFLVLMFGMFLVFEGRITVGYMIAAVNLSNFIITPCQVISQSYARVKASCKIRGKIENMMNPEEQEEVEEAEKHFSKMEVKQVQFAYENTKDKILQDITFTCEKNEKIALLGESGSGKSTLAKILCGNITEYSGDILYYDGEKQVLNQKTGCKWIGYVSQNPYIFHDTIRNNICLYEAYPEEEIRHVLKQVGLVEAVEELEQGLDTVISENVKNLSGGQLQRIALARLVIRKYDLIIVDEITSSLDPETTDAIMKLLLDLDGMVVVITHDTFGEYMERFDKVYEIREGKLSPQKK